jgi:hypothetical protein
MTDATSAIKKVMAPGADQEHGAALFDLNAKSVATRCAPAERQRVSPMPCPRAMRRPERRRFTTRWFAVVSRSAPAAADAPPRSSRFRRRTRKRGEFVRYGQQERLVSWGHLPRPPAR